MDFIIDIYKGCLLIYLLVKRRMHIVQFFKQRSPLKNRKMSFLLKTECWRTGNKKDPLHLCICHMRDVSHYTKNHLWLRAVPCFKPLCLLHWAKFPLKLGQVDLHSRLLSIFFPSQAWPIPICGPAACNYAKSFTEVLVQLLLMQGVFWECFTCFACSLLLILFFFFSFCLPT